MKAFDFIAFSAFAIAGCSPIPDRPDYAEIERNCFYRSPDISSYTSCLELELFNQLPASSNKVFAMNMAPLIVEGVTKGKNTSEAAINDMRILVGMALMDYQNHPDQIDIGAALRGFGAGITQSSKYTERQSALSGFLTKTIDSGLNRICIYSTPAGTHAETVSTNTLCPLTTSK